MSALVTTSTVSSWSQSTHKVPLPSTFYSIQPLNDLSDAWPRQRGSSASIGPQNQMLEASFFFFFFTLHPAHCSPSCHHLPQSFPLPLSHPFFSEYVGWGWGAVTSSLCDARHYPTEARQGSLIPHIQVTAFGNSPCFSCSGPT